MNKLPPLSEEAFENGYKEKTEVNLVKCPHENITLVSGNELKCSCGAGWTGPNILQLYKLLKKT